MGWDESGHPTAKKLAELGITRPHYETQPAA